MMINNIIEFILSWCFEELDNSVDISPESCFYYLGFTALDYMSLLSAVGDAFPDEDVRPMDITEHTTIQDIAYNIGDDKRSTS